MPESSFDRAAMEEDISAMLEDWEFAVAEDDELSNFWVWTNIAVFVNAGRSVLGAYHFVFVEDVQTALPTAADFTVTKICNTIIEMMFRDDGLSFALETEKRRQHHEYLKNRVQPDA